MKFIQNRLGLSYPEEIMISNNPFVACFDTIGDALREDYNVGK